MDPVHPEGSIIIAERKRPPAIGDDIVVYLRDEKEDDGERASGVLVKRLVRRMADCIEVEQFSPNVTFRIAKDRVLRYDRVLTLADLLS